MFLSWDGFANRLTQIYGDPEAKIIAERRLAELTQKGSATDYTTIFQIYTIQTK